MTIPLPVQVEVEEVEPVRLFDFDRRILFLPNLAGERFIKFAVTTGRLGARSVPLAHPRDEVTLTLRGEAVLRAGGQAYRMREGTAIRLPAGLEHEVEILSEEWQVVAACCDDCPLCRGPNAKFRA